jgi:hypothetical protein
VTLVAGGSPPAATKQKDEIEVVGLHRPLETRTEALSLERRSGAAKLAKAQHSTYL